MSVRAQKARIILISLRGLFQNNGWKDAEHGTHVENQQNEIDLEDSTPLIDQVYLGCTQKDVLVHLQTVQSQTELFRKLVTTRETDEKISREKYIRRKRLLFGAML